MGYVHPRLRLPGTTTRLAGFLRLVHIAEESSPLNEMSFEDPWRTLNPCVAAQVPSLPVICPLTAMVEYAAAEADVRRRTSR